MSGPPRETSDQARTRRRWVTLAELVAVAGLLIAAATLYLNWAERRDERADRAAEVRTQRQARATLTVAGEVVDDGDAVALADAAHTIADVTVRFPTALGVAPKDAMPGPRLRAEWIAAPLLALTDKGADDREGRLPVLLAISWWDGDTKREDRALYDLLWRTEGQMLRGRRLTLTGLALRDRTGTPAALERAWRQARPAR